MRTIRASEVGTYLYCQRAWWYQRQGIKPENVAELLVGTRLHQRHGQAVIVSGCLRWVAYGLLLLALAALTVYLSGQLP